MIAQTPTAFCPFQQESSISISISIILSNQEIVWLKCHVFGLRMCKKNFKLLEREPCLLGVTNFTLGCVWHSPLLKNIFLCPWYTTLYGTQAAPGHCTPHPWGRPVRQIPKGRKASMRDCMFKLPGIQRQELDKGVTHWKGSLETLSWDCETLSQDRRPYLQGNSTYRKVANKSHPRIKAALE